MIKARLRLGALAVVVVVGMLAAGCTLPIPVVFVPSTGLARTVQVVAGSVRKICQLVGEADFERNEPVMNATFSRVGLYGTDLGIPVEYAGRLYLLFGDSVAPGHPTRSWNRDAIATSTDTNPDDCVRLDFPTDPDGWFSVADIPGVSLEGLEVPTGAFAANGLLFAFYTTDGIVDQSIMGRSVLAYSEWGTPQFHKLLDVSDDKFINIAPVPVHNADLPGLPESTGDGLLMFASGSWRHSPLHLAWAPLDRLVDRSSWRYLQGVDASGVPQWSTQESDATGMLGPDCYGELSVNFVPTLERWVLLDNCDQPQSAIWMSSAPTPWGPWDTNRKTVFEPWADGGFCHFVHAVQDPPCDQVNDILRETHWGGVYGPYLIPRYTRVEPNGDVTIFFTMGTWNPYTVELMTARLRIA